MTIGLGPVLPPLYPGKTNTDTRAAGLAGTIAKNNARGTIWKLTPIARQRLLKQLGYNVKLDGKAGPQTAAAAWAYAHGKDPKWYNNKGRDWQMAIWNQHFAAQNPQALGRGYVGNDTPALKPQAGPGVQTHKNNTDAQQRSDAQFSGNDPAASMAGSALDSAFTAVLGDTNALAAGANTGVLTDSRSAGRIGTLLDRLKAGDAAVETGFGQTLRDSTREVANLPGRNAQSLADVKNWYDQVASKQAEGAKSTGTMADSLIAAQMAEGASVVNALGGDANLGAGDVAKVGADQAANLRALKLIGASGASELAGAIGSEGLSARIRERVRGENALTTARNTLSDTTAKAGAARTAAEMAADEANNQIMQQRFENTTHVVDSNNAIRQQRFQNTVAAAQARIAALAAVPDLATATAQANFAMSNPTAAFTKSSADGKSKVAKGSWANTSAKDKGAVANQATTAIQGLSEKGASMDEIVRTVNSIYRAQGWSLANPRVVKAIRSTLEGMGFRTKDEWWKGKQ